MCDVISAALPGVGCLKVAEMGMQGLDNVIADQVDHVHISQTGAELFGHLPEVLRQHLIKLSLVPTKRHIPGQDVVPVAVVEH